MLCCCGGRNLGEQPTVNIARSLLGTGPRMLKGRPAQTNKSKGPGRGRSKPLRRGDQTKAMTADRILVEMESLEMEILSTLPRPRARRRQYFNSDQLMSILMVALASSVKTAWRGLMSGDVHCLPWGERLKLSDLAKVVAQKAATSASKGVVISEGSETTSGKRALDDGSKGKQVAQLPESKKAKIDTGASEAPARPPIASGGGSSVRRTLGESLGPQASVMASAATAEKILAGGDTPGGQGEGGQAHLRSGGDQVSPCARPAGDFAECALNQKAVAESAEMEMVRAQNRAIELEGALAEEKAKGKKFAEDADARDKVIARLEARISELEKSQSLTQGRIIAAFKESDDFLEAVRGSASSYFGDGFDFCKRQLAHQYPDLDVDLEDVEMDHEFLAKEEDEAEKRAAEEGAARVERVGEAVV
ncbi:hypothetical protein Acr_00g0100130 [Actinidia rufa]|uniref:Uncharacterized protein n=1 Tax=Actinidia rufa TaxID=165716 RepID=A0A7J0DZY7_9ERIC|nr:hypothetical protein Acr_00g0100130 [Actinidia rufa]